MRRAAGSRWGRRHRSEPHSAAVAQARARARPRPAGAQFQEQCLRLQSHGTGDGAIAAADAGHRCRRFHSRSAAGELRPCAARGRRWCLRACLRWKRRAAKAWVSNSRPVSRPASPAISTASRMPRSACGAAAASCSASLHRFRFQLRARHHARDEAQRQRTRGIDRLAEQAQFQRRARGRHRRSRRWVPPKPGIRPRLISGWPNLAAVGGDAQVAGHRQFHAAAEREAVDHARSPACPSCSMRDHQLLARAREIPRLHRRQAAHLGDVGAGDEGLRAGAGQDDHAHGLASPPAASKAGAVRRWSPG